MSAPDLSYGKDKYQRQPPSEHKTMPAPSNWHEIEKHPDLVRLV